MNRRTFLGIIPAALAAGCHDPGPVEPELRFANGSVIKMGASIGERCRGHDPTCWMIEKIDFATKTVYFSVQK